MGMMMHRSKERRAASEAAHASKATVPVKQIEQEVEQTSDHAEQTEQTYTKTDIAKMSKPELVSVLSGMGAKNVDAASVAELKKILIKKLGL